MTKLEEVKSILYDKKASLVVGYANGDIKEYYKEKIIDIKNIIQKNPKSLKDAVVADKVLGKVAASILIVAGVKEIYTDVISSLAIPILEENSIKYQYLNKVDYIKNKNNTGMCPMENKFKDENDICKIYNEIIP